MKVLMLGWEYPPHISGGLGTACEGLSTALANNQVSIDFVVPHLFGGENAPHMTLVDCADSADVIGSRYDEEVFESGSERTGPVRRVSKRTSRSEVTMHRIPSLLSPYWTEEQYLRQRSIAGLSDQMMAELLGGGTAVQSAGSKQPVQRYGTDIFEEVNRYAEMVVELMEFADFDVIHAHDWMTFPAGVALSRLTKKPLVVHVHSLEFDRSGLSVNQRIHEIERLGVQAANRVVAVSYYTAKKVEEQHFVPADRISVIHNGVYAREVVEKYREERAVPRRIVLFLGRITFQKGPDYFVEAAARVIPHVPDVLFVMAGAGDMLSRMVHRVRELNIIDNFMFPGFLKGEEVEEMFSIADLYVMPSVSEPFGISALEAISFDTPVIISRQSGVAEVLGHALKVDFWDIDRLADLIINSLLHSELREDMVSMAREELKRLHWDAAARKTVELYRQLAAPAI